MPENTIAILFTEKEWAEIVGVFTYCLETQNTQNTDAAKTIQGFKERILDVIGK